MLFRHSHREQPGKAGGSGAIGLHSSLLGPDRPRRTLPASATAWVMARLSQEVRCRAAVRIRISDEFRNANPDKAGDTLREISDELCVGLRDRLLARGVPASQIRYDVRGEFLCADPPFHTAASLVTNRPSFDLESEWREYKEYEAKYPSHAIRDGVPPRHAFTVGGVVQGYFDDRAYRRIVEMAVEWRTGARPFSSDVWYKSDIWIIALDVSAWKGG